MSKKKTHKNRATCILYVIHFSKLTTSLYYYFPLTRSFKFKIYLYIDLYVLAFIIFQLLNINYVVVFHLYYHHIKTLLNVKFSYVMYAPYLYLLISYICEITLNNNIWILNNNIIIPIIIYYYSHYISLRYTHLLL